MFQIHTECSVKLFRFLQVYAIQEKSKKVFCWNYPNFRKHVTVRV